MILLLLVLDVLDGVVLQLSLLSEDFRGLSGRGDLRESVRGCLALIESGMHFDLPEVDLPFSIESDGLQFLPIGRSISAQEIRELQTVFAHGKVAIM